MALVIAKPKKSPSLGAMGPSIGTFGANKIPVVAVCRPAADGTLNLGSAVLVQGKVSQVTGLQDPPYVTTPAGDKIPLMALMELSSTGVPQNLSSGKYQSAVRTATGSAETIAHGLGVAPSVVLISVYDLNGQAAAVLVEGSHTSTNLIVTVSASVKYKVIAFA